MIKPPIKALCSCDDHRDALHMATPGIKYVTVITDTLTNTEKLKWTDDSVLLRANL